jgi:hypothetical protein
MRADPLRGDRMGVDWAAKSRSGTTPVPHAELVSRLLAGLASRLAVVGWGSSAGLARTSAELGLVAVPHQYRAPSSCSSRVTVRRSGGRRPGSRLGPVGRQGPSRYHTSTVRAEIVLAGGRWMSAGQRPDRGGRRLGSSAGAGRSARSAAVPHQYRTRRARARRASPRRVGVGRDSSAGAVAVPHQYRARRARARGRRGTTPVPRTPSSSCGVRPDAVAQRLARHASRVFRQVDSRADSPCGEASTPVGRRRYHTSTAHAELVLVSRLPAGGLASRRVDSRADSCGDRVDVGWARRLGPVGRPGAQRYHTSTAHAELVLGARLPTGGRRQGLVGRGRRGTTPVPRTPSSCSLRRARSVGRAVAVPHQYCARRA